MKQTLSIKNLTHHYGRFKALDNVTVEFKPGIYGLIGPNGAGKSTLIKLISGLLVSKDESIFYAKHSIGKLGTQYKNMIGLMPQNQRGYEEYSGYSFLQYMSVLKGISRKEAKIQIDALVKQVSLEDSIHRKIGTYSGGMRQRLMFAQSILGDPKILILDEPTAGLDPFERIKLRNFISTFSKDRIVIIATHVMQDVESIADELILLDQGKLIFNGSGEKLLNTLKGVVFETIVESKNELEALQQKYRVSRVYKFENKYMVKYIDTSREDGNVLANFEDAYLYYMVDQDAI